MKHTHRTHQVRTDHELLALSILLTFNGQGPTPGAIESWEDRFRGNREFEAALRQAGEMLEREAPTFKAEPHQCGGQMCDHDGKFDVRTVVEDKNAY